MSGGYVIEVPEEIGELRYLRELKIEGTSEGDKYGYIVGTLPETLSNLIELRSVDIYNTKLTGPLPDWSKCKEMREIYIQENYFTGTLPLWLAGLPKLSIFRYGGNCFSGKIDESLTQTQWWNAPCTNGNLLGIEDMRQKDGYILYL